MHRAVVISCVAVILVLAALTVWGPGRGARQAGFVFNNGSEVNSLDPHLPSWVADVRIANALFEGLMAFKVEAPAPGEQVGTVAPTYGVAERYEVSPDGRTYTFHLRSNARWSNGEPVTAEHFRWSWQRVMTPVTAADYATMMFVIQGAKAYYEALAQKRAASFDTVGVAAPDHRTLVVTLTAPTAYFLELTAFIPFFPVYPPLLRQFPEDRSDTDGGARIGAYTAEWTKPEHIVSNGPFILKSHRFKRDLVLEPNPHYWDRAAVKIPRVTALAIEDLDASRHAYESGECDWTGALPPGWLRGVVALPPPARRRDFVRVTSFGTYYYRFNCQATLEGGRRNPFADPRVRRAFALAVDKADVVRVTGLDQPVAGSFVPPGLTVNDAAGTRYAYQSPPGLAHDLDAARKLLAKAGYPDARDLGEVRLMYNQSAAHEAIALRLAAIWKAALGAQTALAVKDANAFSEALKKRTDKAWHLARSTWIGDYRDPSTFLQLLVTDDGNNDCGYSNPAYDALMAAAAATDDQARRLDLFRQAEDIAVNQDAAILPLYYFVDHYLVRERVRGAWPNQMGYLVLKQVTVDR